MFKVLLVLVLALVLEAVGVVVLSRGLRQIGAIERMTTGEVVRLVRAGATNPSLLAGIALEAVFFGALLYLLSQRDVSLIWPLTSLGFVLTALAARFILKEEVSPLRWLGVALIVFGAVCITWSEQQKKLRAEHSAWRAASGFDSTR
jgi:drug/metabolite transporter (DMT)-like permease